MIQFKFMLIDSHAHLTDTAFDADRKDVLERAGAAGVGVILNAALDRASLEASLRLSEENDFIYTAGGVHPSASSSEDIFPLPEHPALVAVGEIGLDYYRDYASKKTQEKVFRAFLRTAEEKGLPVIIHQRNAQEDVLRIIKEEMSFPVRGVMHCFSGDIKWAKKCMDAGFYISFAGNITYPNAHLVRAAAEFIPVERMLMETDCPWLAPQKRRGKRCEPADVKYTAEELARIKGLSCADIARITSLNFRTLFKTGAPPDAPEVAYAIRDSLYLNITGKCTSECTFCVKNFTYYVKGHWLKLDKEPSAEEIIKAAGDVSRYREVVFCGLGEPMLRLDTIKAVSAWLKKKGAKVRIDTAGHANLIYGRTVAPELRGLIDAVSVSLNADTAEKYEKLCRPVYGKKTFDEVKRFIVECTKYIPEVVVTAVDMPGVSIDKCRAVAEELGASFRVRRYNEVG